MTAKKLSNITDQLVPLEVQLSYPNFSTFVQSYFEFLEREFGEYDAIVNLLNYRDIDETVDQFLDEFLKTYADPISENAAGNLKQIIKQIRNFYQAKGTEQSFTYLFKAVYDSALEFYFPKDDTAKTSTFQHKLSENNCHLTDSNYWQDFSYVLRTGVDGATYENLLYALGHPAGLKLFGEFKPVADELDLNLSFVESVICVILIDQILGVNGLNFQVAAEEYVQLLTKNTNGPVPSFSRMTSDVEDFITLLRGREEDYIYTFSGQASEQKALVFYERLKQDADSYKADNNFLRFYDNGVSSDFYFDPFSNTTTQLQTDISFTAPSTITIAASVDPSTLFANSDDIRVVTTSGVNDGTYTVASTTGTTIVTNEATITTETAGAAGESKVYNLSTAEFYNTTLRPSPMANGADLAIIKTPGADFVTSEESRAFQQFPLSAKGQSNDNFMAFFEGRKIPQSQIAISGPTGDGFYTAGNNSAQTINARDKVEVHYFDHTAEEFTAVEGSDQTINLVSTPENVVVFIDGYYIKHTEYTISGNDITIQSAVLTALSADGLPIEVCHIPNIGQFKQEYFTFSTGQEIFELEKVLEKKRFADSSDSIRIWDGSTPDTGSDPTPVAGNGFNYTGNIDYIDAGEPQFPLNWTENLYESPVNYNYNVGGNTDTGTGDVEYSLNQRIGERFTNDPFRIRGRVFGQTSALNIDGVGIQSKMLRRVNNGGKFVAKLDVISTDGLAAINIAVDSAMTNMNYNLNDTRGLAFQDGGSFYDKGSFDSSPTENQAWSNSDEIYIFIDFDNDLVTLNFNGTTLMAGADISTFSNFMSVGVLTAGDNTGEYRMDYNPDLSGVSSFPSSTSSGDWVGWGDWDQWRTQYEFIPITNDVNDWSTTTAGGQNSLAQGADGSVLFRGRLQSPTITLANSGAYCYVAQGTHQAGIGTTDINVDLVVNTVVSGSSSTMEDTFYTSNNYFGTGWVARQFTGTAGQDIELEFESDNTTIEKAIANCYLIRRI